MDKKASMFLKNIIEIIIPYYWVHIYSKSLLCHRKHIEYRENEETSF